ncbi:MAG: response regulator [Acidimicrobiales bacterium]
MRTPLDPEPAGEPVPAPQRVNPVGEPPLAQRLIEAALDCVPLRVVLVDDAPSTRRLLRAVIDCVPALTVVDEADNGSHAIGSVERLQPDVVLLDLSLPDTDGARVLPELLRVAPGVKIVVLSHSSRSAGPDLVAAGAAGFIEKGLAPYALVNQLSSVLGVPLTVVSTLPDP